MMFVRRKTMERVLHVMRMQHSNQITALANLYGGALVRSEALQKQLVAWITEKGEALTPEQMADLFYSHDDRWQAAFFNVMQERVSAKHDAMPPRRPNEFCLSPGVPAGETQWCYMADHLDESGFETLEAMYEHAKYWREKRAA